MAQNGKAVHVKTMTAMIIHATVCMTEATDQCKITTTVADVAI